MEDPDAEAQTDADDLDRCGAPRSDQGEGTETVELTRQQSLRIAELPDDYRVIGADGSAPLVRKPTGQIIRIQQSGRLTAATVAAKRRLADRRADERFASVEQSVRES